MALYPYVATLAVDPVTLVKAAGATGQIFAPEDTTFTNPLTATDAVGNPISLTSNTDGILPSFYSTAPAVNWRSGSYTFPLVTSVPLPGPEGQPGAPGDPGRDGSNVLPTAQAVAEAITNPGPANSAINATIADALEEFTPTDTPRQYFIGDDLTIARPDHAGPIYWVTTVVDGTPIHAVSGDQIIEVSAQPFSWTPATLDLLGWYQPASLGLTNGAQVTNLPDLSGSNRHLLSTAPLAEGAVEYTAAGLNGTPGLSFDGLVGRLATTTFTATPTGPITMYMVAAAASPAGTRYLVSGEAANSIGISLNAAGNYGARRGETFYTGTTVTNNAAHAVIAVFNGASSAVYVDGVSVASGTVGTYAATALILGARAGANVQAFNGTMGEFFWSNGAASPQQIADATQYLRESAGLA